MSKRWISSDLHFNHQRIIEFCPSSRGHCSSVDHMNEVIINNFNSVIKPQDTLYLLGDIGFGKVEPNLDLIGRLNGTKIWIHGNHDRKFWVNDSYYQRKTEIGVKENIPYKTISHTVDNVKYGLVLFHFPIESWEGQTKGSIHLHGHLHSLNQCITRRRMDVGVDGNNLMPYSLDDVVRLLSSMPIDKDYHDN